MPQIVPCEVFDVGVFHLLCPPPFIIADGKDRILRRRMRSAFPPIEPKFLQSSEGCHDIIDHVDDATLAILRVTQRNQALLEIDTTLLQAVLLTLPHSGSQRDVEFTEAMLNPRS